MPLIAFALAKGLELPNIAALGLVVMGMCPGGATSNLFALLARADVALSIAMAAASKLLGVVLMPVCLYVYARPFTGEQLPIPYFDIVKTLVLLLVPVAIAMLLRRRFGEGFARTAEKVGSLAGLSVLLLLVAVSVFRNADVFKTLTAEMIAAAAMLGGLGMLLGSLGARACGLATAQRRTVAFETGIQNSPLCFAILVTAFPSANQLQLLKLPLLYALFVLLEAAVVTLIYRLLDARRGTLAGSSWMSKFAR
jgi:bile acid transporter